MKKITITSIILLNVLIGNAQWNTISSGTDKNLSAISFADNLNGAICGKLGLVLFTSDGGASWTEKSLPGTFPVDLHDVSMVSDSTAWVVGVSGKIYKTTDKGNTWTEQFWNPTLSTYRLYSVFFVDENTGWATGMSGSVIHTTDGGETPWQDQTTTECFYWNKALFFLDENTGWVAGQYETIDKTTNGGSTWSGLNSETDPGITINDIYFIDENKGWLAGTLGEVWYTTDGGANWNKTQPSQFDLNAVFFVNENIGYTVGNEGRFIKSSNGGQTWLTDWNIGTTEVLTDLHFFDENHGIVIGYAGTILSYGNTGASVQSIESSNILVTYPNPTSDIVNFDFFENNIQKLTIFDAKGKLRIEKNDLRQNETINLSSFESGVYIINIQTDNDIYTTKIIKN